MGSKNKDRSSGWVTLKCPRRQLLHTRTAVPVGAEPARGAPCLCSGAGDLPGPGNQPRGILSIPLLVQGCSLVLGPRGPGLPGQLGCSLSFLREMQKA